MEQCPKCHAKVQGVYNPQNESLAFHCACTFYWESLTKDRCQEGTRRPINEERK